jgi:hypothetical protein
MTRQEARYRSRAAWTLIRDAYITARYQRAGAYFGPYADALLFAMKALKQRPLGARRHIPKAVRTTLVPRREP